MKSTSLALYTEELARHDPLSREEELKLAKKMQGGDKEAREELIKRNLRFVVRVAKHYDKGALPLEDLISVGNEGLLRAAEDFDPSQGARFITYAVWWIRQAILAALANERTIRLPRNRVGELIRILRAKDHRVGLIPEELGKDLHLKPELVSQLLRLAPEPTSISAKARNENSDPLVNCLEDRQGDSSEKSSLVLDLQNALAKALGTLPKREQLVLEHCYGLGGKKQLWLGEIGLKLGVSKERVRKIQEHALMVLRRDHRQALEQYLGLEN